MLQERVTRPVFVADQGESNAGAPERYARCFPEMISLGQGRYWVFNYTSDPDAEEMSWFDGQIGPTLIYHTVLTLP